MVKPLPNCRLNRHSAVEPSRDTSIEAEQRQIDIWRRMTPLEKAALVRSASRAVRSLSLAGIRQRYPSASEEDCRMRFARLTLGVELFERVYPDAALLLRS